MNDVTWRLRVWGPLGQGPAVISADQSVLDETGLRAQLTPEGDTREVAMNNRGLPRAPELAIGALNAVQFQLWDGVRWVSRWYAQVRVGGNVRNETGENLVLRSLALRLKYVKLSRTFTTPRQAAHLTVRAMIQDAVNSGQLGRPTLIEYDAALCPDLGFDCEAITDASQQNPYALLESLQKQGLAASPPVDLRFGVDPDRRFYCRLAKSDVRELQDADVLGVPEWKEPVAEDPCTMVTWFVAQRPDGSWFTHESVRMDADPYGVWNRSLTLDSTIEPWTAVSYSLQWFAKAPGSGAWMPAAEQPQPNLALLSDRVTDGAASQSLTVTGYRAALQVNAGQEIHRLSYALQARMVGGAAPQPVIAVVSPGALQDVSPVALQANVPPGFVPGQVFTPRDRITTAMLVVSAQWDADTTQVAFDLAELRPEIIDGAKLDGLARFYYSTPAPEPADITLTEVPEPGQMTGRIGWHDYGRAVEVYELRLSGEGGLEMGVLTGQADDPRVLSQAAVIRARDQGAVITAVTAQR